MLKRVIVGHDLGPGGECALRSAVLFADRYGAEIKVIHVIEPHPVCEKISHPVSTRKVPNAVAKRAGEKLESIVSRMDDSDLEVHYEVCVGKPFVEIMVARRAWQADLIVIGGSRHSDGIFNGSTGDKLISKSLVPVLIASQSLSTNPKTFLVPTDFSAGARQAAYQAIGLAEILRARIIFLYVVDLYPFYSSAYGDETFAIIPELKPEEIESEWDSFLSALPLGNTAWEKRVKEGITGSTIIRQAKTTNTDLIVMGTHGRTGLNHMLLGSVTERVVNGAPCPVLTMRPDACQFSLPVTAGRTLKIRASRA